MNCFKLDIFEEFIFFNFQARMRGKKLAKKYNIDCFGYTVNLEFKLNFDEEDAQK
jgi:hypothetical protein